MRDALAILSFFLVVLVVVLLLVRHDATRTVYVDPDLPTPSLDPTPVDNPDTTQPLPGSPTPTPLRFSGQGFDGDRTLWVLSPIFAVVEEAVDVDGTPVHLRETEPGWFAVPASVASWRPVENTPGVPLTTQSAWTANLPRGGRVRLVRGAIVDGQVVAEEVLLETYYPHPAASGGSP